MLFKPQTKETDETLNRNPLGLFDCHCHWRWHGCALGGMVVSMNKNDIILMAQEAGFFVKDNEAYSPSNQEDFELTECLERFADRVYAQYLEQPTPSQTGVISITVPEPVAYLCENAAGHRYFRWKKPSGIYKPIALYTKGQA